MPNLDATLFAGYSVSIAFDLPDTLSHLTYLRNKVRALLAHLDVTRQDIDDLELIIGELATNVIRHAQSGTYQVTLTFSEGNVQVQVMDKGRGFSPDTVSEPGTPRPEELPELYEAVQVKAETAEPNERIGGFGLPLVRSLTDQLAITTNTQPAYGTTIRATKRLQRPESGKPQ